MRFHDLVGSLEQHLGAEGVGVPLWLDIFAINQVRVRQGGGELVRCKRPAVGVGAVCVSWGYRSLCFWLAWWCCAL